MKTVIISILCALCLFVLVAQTFADPGIRDTVKFEGTSLVVGQSWPITVTIVNDEALGAYQLGMLLESHISGFATFDSAVYVNRMTDPSVLSYRVAKGGTANGVSPDTIILGGANIALGNNLPVGDDAIFELYFTGTAVGAMVFDSTFFKPSGFFTLSDAGGISFFPAFVGDTISVVTGGPLPEINVPDSPDPILDGEAIQWVLYAGSSTASPMTITMDSFTDYDNETSIPDNSPTLTGTNPATFSWTPATGDIGIWQVTFTACDTAGSCVSESRTIQVVGDDSYIINFDVSITNDVTPALGSIVGNFDNDANPELLLHGSGYGNTYSVEVYDYSNGSMNNEFQDYYNRAIVGPQKGYLDGDDNIDIAFSDLQGSMFTIIDVLLGNGDNTFTASGTPTSASVSRASAIGEFTGDNFLDLAFVHYAGVTIYSGSNSPSFTYNSFFATSDSALTINSADFNNDGYDDLAVGTKAGVVIYLQNPTTHAFTAAYSYAQSYESAAIEVTNQGSDFDNDDIFDLCISTPSVAGEESEMNVYLGNGDGSFTANTANTVKGQIFGNCVGDMNLDGNLDIIYVNGARKYIAILYGNGDGTFTNEVRYFISQPNPQRVACADFDLDGDLDIAVISLGPIFNNDLLLFKNQLNPQQFSQSDIGIAICNNADMNLVSQSGLKLNDISKTMPASDLLPRNIDDSPILDKYATLHMVEDGRYLLSAKPRPDLPAGEPFSIEFTVNGTQYRLADNAIMRPQGYTFDLYLNGTSPVMPRSGTIQDVNPPSFHIMEAGTYNFQLASDPGFENIIYTETFTGQDVVIPTGIPVTDMETFYWRYKTDGAPSYDCLYAITLGEPIPPLCGDVNGDSKINIGDPVFLVNYVFRGGETPDPLWKADVNSDGSINIADAVLIVNYVFKGGAAPFCNQ